MSQRLNRFYVYVLYRPWDGTPCYVGKGQGDRLDNHEAYGSGHYNKYLGNIFKKAKRLGLVVRKEKRYRRLSEFEAFQHEIDLIKWIGRYPNGPLVNMTDGGEGLSGYVPSELTRLKHSLANKKATADPEYKAAHSLRIKALWERPGFREKQRALFKKTRSTPAYRMKQSAVLKEVFKRTDVLAAHRDRMRSPEQRAKASAVHKKMWNSPEGREKRSQAAKKLWADPEYRLKRQKAKDGGRV